MEQAELEELLGIGSTCPQAGPSDIEKLKSRVIRRKRAKQQVAAGSDTPLLDGRLPTSSVIYQPIAESQPYGLIRVPSSTSRSVCPSSPPRVHAQARSHVQPPPESEVKEKDYASATTVLQTGDHHSGSSGPVSDDAAQRMLEGLIFSLNGLTSRSESRSPQAHIAASDITPLEVQTDLDGNDGSPDVGDQSVTTDVKQNRRTRVVTINTRIPGTRRRRIGYRVIRRSAPGEGYAGDIEEGAETDEPSLPEPIPEPPTPFQRHLQNTFQSGALAQVENLARIDNTLGNHLPSQFREIFTSMADLSTAVDIANHLRRQIDLPPLSMRTDRVALRRAIAQMRLALYTDLVSALALPLAPEPTPMTDDEDEKIRVDKISLTPSSIRSMAQTLPNVFPREKYAIKRFLANDDAPYGERKGRVVWTQGIGKMVGGDPMGPGFRGKTTDEGSVHVFVDHSNVLFGLTNHIHKLDTRDLPPRHLRTLSLPVLSLLLRRGRYTPHGTLHLVASSPLHQNLDPLVRLGWEVSVLKRVEVYEDEVLDSSANKMVPKPQQQSALVKQGLSAGGGGLRRYREQGVDEILHLKLLQALNSSDSPSADGSTIVLATGDAKGGQFNRDGFLGAVREAIRRGWSVELWSFSEGLSHTWRDVKRKEKWDGKFTIRLFDDWATQMVEVGESQ